jgi:DNA processing protein
MSEACIDCLTRARLLQALASRLERLADRTERPVRGLLALPNDDLLVVARVDESERAAARRAARAAASEDARRSLDGAAVCIHSERYPPRLRELPDPPHALFHTGPLDRLERLSSGSPVAVVGSRKASDQGLEAAYQLGRGLAAADLTVVSGMAFGIDAACHRGALAGGGAAIAVLASGPDRASPAANRALHSQLRSVATVVSEMPWGARPWRWLFPARNRIMAALGHMTIVVEAAAQSGSLITATFAEDLGRTVGAMPGAPGARLTGGNNGLLRDGCAVIRDVRDVLDELYGVGMGEERQAETARRPIAGDPVLLSLLDAVEIGVPLEQIGERLDLDARQLRIALGRLERTGLVRRAGLHGYVATTTG